MSVKLKMLEQRLARGQAPAGVPSPTPAGGLAAAFEQLVQQEVDRRVGEQRPRSPRLRRLLDGFNQKPQATWKPLGEPFDPAPEPWHPEDFGDGPEPAQRSYIQPLRREPIPGAEPAKSPPVEGNGYRSVIHRDAAGVARSITATFNGREHTFLIERGADGRATGAVEV